MQIQVPNRTAPEGRWQRTRQHENRSDRRRATHRRPRNASVAVPGACPLSVVRCQLLIRLMSSVFCNGQLTTDNGRSFTRGEDKSSLHRVRDDSLSRSRPGVQCPVRELRILATYRNSFDISAF